LIRYHCDFHAFIRPPPSTPLRDLKTYHYCFSISPGFPDQVRPSPFYVEVKVLTPHVSLIIPICRISFWFFNQPEFGLNVRPPCNDPRIRGSDPPSPSLTPSTLSRIESTGLPTRFFPRQYCLMGTNLTFLEVHVVPGFRSLFRASISLFPPLARLPRVPIPSTWLLAWLPVPPFFTFVVLTPSVSVGFALHLPLSTIARLSPPFSPRLLPQLSPSIRY